MVLMLTMTFFEKVIILSFTTFAVFLGYGKVNVATYKDIIDTIYLF